MAKTNSINNASSELTIDPGASGDSFIQFDINTTGEFRIGVDDTDDSFRISQGSALGTTDTVVVSSAGEIIKPLQPYMLATVSTTQTNVTGAGTLYQVVCDTEVTDIGGNYNPGTGLFTCPVDGIYQMVFIFGCAAVTAAMTGAGCGVFLNGGQAQSYSANNIANLRNPSTNACDVIFSIPFAYSSGDTLQPFITVSNGAGDTMSIGTNTSMYIYLIQ